MAPTTASTERGVTKHGWKKLKVGEEGKKPHAAQIYLIFMQVRERLIYPVKDQFFS